jgi:hypothetical protein
VGGGGVLQAWGNFAQEWLQLRRSFRYDEYHKIAEANPPQGPIGKASYAAGSVVVSLFSRVDQWLEDRRFFTMLLPTMIPLEVTDQRTGSIRGECREVRSCSGGPVGGLPHDGGGSCSGRGIPPIVSDRQLYNSDRPWSFLTNITGSVAIGY